MSGENISQSIRKWLIASATSKINWTSAFFISCQFLFCIHAQEMLGFFFLPSGPDSFVSERIHFSPWAVGKQTQDLAEPMVYEGLAWCSLTKSSLHCAFLKILDKRSCFSWCLCLTANLLPLAFLIIHCPHIRCGTVHASLFLRKACYSYSWNYNTLNLIIIIQTLLHEIIDWVFLL